MKDERSKLGSQTTLSFKSTSKDDDCIPLPVSLSSYDRCSFMNPSSCENGSTFQIKNQIHLEWNKETN